MGLVPFGKALSKWIPRRGLKAVGPLVAYLQAYTYIPSSQVYQTFIKQLLLCTLHIAIWCRYEVTLYTDCLFITPKHNYIILYIYIIRPSQFLKVWLYFFLPTLTEIIAYLDLWFRNGHLLHLHLTHRERQFDFVIFKVVMDNYHMRQPLDAMFVLYVITDNWSGLWRTVTSKAASVLDAALRQRPCQSLAHFYVKFRVSPWRSVTSKAVTVLDAVLRQRPCQSLTHSNTKDRASPWRSLTSKAVTVLDAVLRQRPWTFQRTSLTLEHFLHYRIYYSLDTATVLR